MDWRKALAYTNGAVDQELQLRTVLSAKTKRSTNRVRQAPKVETMRLHHSNSALDAFVVECVPVWTSLVLTRV